MGRKNEIVRTDQKKQAVQGRGISLHFGNGRILSVYIILMVILALAVCFLLLAPGLARGAARLMGSFEGITVGLGEGARDGKEEGLDAKDITMRIGTEMENTAKLEVLLVSLKLSDIYTQGDYYAALYSMGCEVVFTVDLGRSKAELNEEGQIEIDIPEPEFTIYIDDETAEVLDEHKKNLTDGKSKDGYNGYLNSREKMEEKAEEELLQNAELLEQARAVAKKQTEALAKSVSGSNLPIIVRFKGEGE